NRQPQRPSRRSDHQPGEFIGATEAFRHFANGFVMHVQYDAVAGALEAQHGGGKQIARDCGHDVLCPQTSVSAVATAAIAPLPGRRVFEHDYLVFEIFDFNSWIRVGELAAARQFDEQVGAGALEQKSAAANYMFALAYGFPSGTIDGVPE